MRVKRILCFVCLAVLQPTSAMSWRDAKRFVDEHNRYRKMLVDGELANQPTARYMRILSWDRLLSRNAQRLASECRVGHDSGSERATPTFPLVGQNWAGTDNYTDAVRLWFEEYRFYDYRENTCEPGKLCGHYTQLVWAETRKIGCGVQNCPASTFPYGYSVVCNYGPAGNFLGQRPYATKDDTNESDKEEYLIN
ncbi:hypothetical protein CRM22_002006 [Opisthorchis felineus]|uniref:SCP domain-containing protein n=1 Tax=Opisthorchis felineus TaxID=147828 RepID=A0A4S2M884_OPIFE|nr:hypothetical protein CRM22_002006 [Opisthorchis felineus]